MDKVKEVMDMIEEYGKDSFSHGLNIIERINAKNDEGVRKDAYKLWDQCKAIESKLRELLECDPVAHLWQHSETGRTRVIMAGDVWTSSREWSYVGPLVLGIGNESKEM